LLARRCVRLLAMVVLPTPDALWEWCCSFMDWTTLKSSGAASLHGRRLLMESLELTSLDMLNRVNGAFSALTKVLSCMGSGVREIEWRWRQRMTWHYRSWENGTAYIVLYDDAQVLAMI
jgi:hypothetical protein